MQRWKILNKMERKFGNIAIPNLMTLIVFGMVIVYAVDLFINPEYDFNLSSLIMFDRDAIFHGQVWRLLTFIFMPDVGTDMTNVFFAVFAFYFDWFVGSSLENNWGTFRFNVYYFTGVLTTIIVGLLTGYATSSYLNMSLFLAFAMLYPNMELLLFFFIPIKVKYIAILDAILLMVSFVFGGVFTKLIILVAFANFLLYFGVDLWNGIRMWIRRISHKTAKYNSPGKTYDHWWEDDKNNPFKK